MPVRCRLWIAVAVFVVAAVGAVWAGLWLGDLAVRGLQALVGKHPSVPVRITIFAGTVAISAAATTVTGRGLRRPADLADEATQPATDESEGRDVT